MFEDKGTLAVPPKAEPHQHSYNPVLFQWPPPAPHGNTSLHGHQCWGAQAAPCADLQGF